MRKTARERELEAALHRLLRVGDAMDDGIPTSKWNDARNEARRVLGLPKRSYPS